MAKNNNSKIISTNSNLVKMSSKGVSTPKIKEPTAKQGVPGKRIIRQSLK